MFEHKEMERFPGPPPPSLRIRLLILLLIKCLHEPCEGEVGYSIEVFHACAWMDGWHSANEAKSIIAFALFAKHSACLYCKKLTTSDSESIYFSCLWILWRQDFHFQSLFKKIIFSTLSVPDAFITQPCFSINKFKKFISIIFKYLMNELNRLLQFI